MIEKIISGGQTGADQGGLEAGKELGIPTGGTAPLGWKTERGPMPALLRDTYNLVPNWSSGYPDRTRVNVLDSDGTVVFGDFYSPGSELTKACCKSLSRPLYRVCREDTPVIEKQDFLNWLEKFDIRVLNVAGNRESRNLGIQERVRSFLVAVLSGIM